MKKVLIILLVLSITIIAYAAFTGAGVRFVRPLHPQVNTVGLIAHYKMWDGLMTTGEIFDYTCTGKDGSLHDTDATLIPTYPGFNFTPNNDYISIDDHDDFTPGGTDLITNGDFSAWAGDNPTGWTVYGEVGADPMVNEVGALQGFGGAGTGYCNIYTSTGAVIDFHRDFVTVVGQEYRVRLDINLVADGGIVITDARHNMWTEVEYSTTGIKTFTFVATQTNPSFMVARQGTASCDVTLDDISVTPVNPFSISAWVYMHNSVDFIIASKGILNTDLEWWFYLGAGSQFGLICADESIINCYIGRYYNTSLASREDEWIHFIGTYDGGTASSGIKLYLNGVQVDNTNLENNTGSFVAVENLNHDVWIGRYDASYADGVIDDMMFFGKELSIIEVRNIYEVTRWRYSR